MQLDPNHVHIWAMDLSITPAQEKNFLAILSHDEQERIHRIRLSKHKQRSIAARGALRQILSLYLSVRPETIIFAYGQQKKPYLAENPTQLEFNLAHSEDHAIYALTPKYAVGIDIEKIQANYNPDIALRYFSAEENAALTKLPINEQTGAFYRLWSRKEAMVKAIGMGLTLPLSSFSVSSQASAEVITIDRTPWSLIDLPLVEDFAAALATNQTIKAISYWRLTADGYTMIK